MSMTIAQLCQRVAKHFPNFEKLNDSTVRFTRTAGDRPFAVYYIDITPKLPTTQDLLTKYQDQIIGGNYFKGQQSLQWSNYLYFVATEKHLATSQFQRAKELIENDRNYARKFVISEQELDWVLTPPVIEPASSSPRTNILSIWTDQLVKAGLDNAIFSDDDLPQRLLEVESSSPAPAKRKSPTPRTARSRKAPPFIASVALKRYRAFPLKRLFEFGTVNLLYGPNASGKTSLLEAIEMLYCGQNKRNPGHPADYEIVATLADGQIEKAVSSRKLELFRQRNLEWYGQPEIKTSTLYRSFAQFNFLDTDAAVSLAESKDHIEDDLSKLLVGPDASQTWRNIERVCEALNASLRDLRPREEQARGELAILTKQVKEASKVKKESDAIRASLDTVVKRLGWRSPKGTSEVFANNLLEALSELVSLAQQTAEMDWIPSPTSLNSLTTFCKGARTEIPKTEQKIDQLEKLIAQQKQLSNSIARDQEALEFIGGLRRFISAEVPERAAERSKKQNAAAAYANWLAGFDSQILEALSGFDQNAAVRVALQAANSQRAAAQRNLAAKKREYDNFTKLRDQSVRLAQELREVAAAILKSSATPEECPLCHTKFAPGELGKHINVGIDAHFEQQGQALLTEVRAYEAALQKAASLAASVAWISKFCDQANIATESSVRTAVARIEEVRKQLSDASARLEILENDLHTLEGQGLSVDKFLEISGRLKELGRPLEPASLNVADKAIATIKRELDTAWAAVRTVAKQVEELQEALGKTLGLTKEGVLGFRRDLSRWKERSVATQRLHAGLAEFGKSFPWANNKPVAELRIAADSVRKMAVDLQAALSKEKISTSAYNESVKRRAELQKQLAGLRPRLKRYREAHAALVKLRDEHSLNAAMRSALQENRQAIETIFARIHAPAEFSGLGPTITTLRRKADDELASLNEISTGQRAAFGLSVFLAKNSQLIVAPPVVLIDDPIAHVDDLNSLSFLDFLREIVLTGRKQIFFATANDKLATLFERKFDFLGPSFRRFNLTREEHKPAEASLH